MRFAPTPMHLLDPPIHVLTAATVEAMLLVVAIGRRKTVAVADKAKQQCRGGVVLSELLT